MNTQRAPLQAQRVMLPSASATTHDLVGHQVTKARAHSEVATSGGSTRSSHWLDLESCGRRKRRSTSPSLRPSSPLGHLRFLPTLLPHSVRRRVVAQALEPDPSLPVLWRRTGALVGYSTRAQRPTQCPRSQSRHRSSGSMSCVARARPPPSARATAAPIGWCVGVICATGGSSQHRIAVGGGPTCGFVCRRLGRSDSGRTPCPSDK